MKSEEEMSSIKSRQSLRRLILAGKIGEAIKQTQRLYPELLEPDENADLLFMLKVRVKTINFSFRNSYLVSISNLAQFINQLI